MALFPDKSALLARVNGTRGRALVRLCCFAPSKLRSPEIQGWQTRRAVALSSHRPSRGPIGRHGCYIDSTHFTSNTQQCNHLRASHRCRSTEQSASRGLTFRTRARMLKIRAPFNPAPCRALKLVRPNHSYMHHK